MKKEFKITGCHNCLFAIEGGDGEYYCEVTPNTLNIGKEMDEERYHENCEYSGGNSSLKLIFEEEEAKPAKCLHCDHFFIAGSSNYFGYCDEKSGPLKYNHVVGPDNHAYDCDHFETDGSTSFDCCDNCTHYEHDLDMLEAGGVGGFCSEFGDMEINPHFFCKEWSAK